MALITELKLEPLLKCLDELLDFMYGLGLKKLPYFVRFIERMKYNIQTCITVRYDRLELLEEVLRRDWREANNTLLGIPDFVMPAKSREERKMLELRFLKLIGRIDMYINN